MLRISLGAIAAAAFCILLVACVTFLACPGSKPEREPAYTPVGCGQCTLSSNCERAPACLMGEAPQCLSKASSFDLGECARHSELCGHDVYMTHVGVMVTLPVLGANVLGQLYKKHFNAQDEGHFDFPKVHRRAAEQHAMISRYLDAERPLSILEIGCMHGLLLSQFNSSVHRRDMMCFEGSTQYHAQLQRRFTDLELHHSAPGGRARLVPELFSAESLAPGTADVIMSSHVVEHMPDPCPWLEAVWRTLKPGGLVFTEVPLQQRNVVRGEIPGMFHLLFFNRTSFLAMMRSAGFQHVVDVPTPSKGQNDGPLRTLFRRPDRRPNRVGLPGGHA